MSTRSVTWSIAATSNMPAGCRWSEQLHLVRQGHGRSGNNRDYVLAAVKEIEAQGYRDKDLELLAARLRRA